MEYKVKGLNELSKQFHQFQVKMGFTDANITQRLMLITSEVAEAFEAYRKDRFCNFTPGKQYVKDEEFKEDFERQIKDTMEDEMADVIIRALAFCGENNINIEAHIKDKMKYNELRGFKFGGKKF